MYRRFITTLILLCMCWQSLAYAGVDVFLADEHEQAHALLHFEGEAHHHDEHDGDFHEDESPDSIQHAMHDASVFAPVLLIDIPGTLQLTFGTTHPSDAICPSPPYPFLSGPERPPKALT